MPRRILLLMKKCASFFKRYGTIVLICVGLFIVTMLYTGGFAERLRVDRMLSSIRRERDMHDRYVAKLNDIDEVENAARDKAARRALEAVTAAEKQYEARNEVLDAKKRKMITKLVERTDDPELLSKQLADSFGFTYVPTGENSDA